MCLTIPSRIVSIDNLRATVEVLGSRREISLILLPAKAELGDFVLVHGGFAVQIIDQTTALENINLIIEAYSLSTSTKDCSDA